MSKADNSLSPSKLLWYAESDNKIIGAVLVYRGQWKYHNTYGGNRRNIQKARYRAWNDADDWRMCKRARHKVYSIGFNRHGQRFLYKARLYRTAAYTVRETQLRGLIVLNPGWGFLYKWLWQKNKLALLEARRIRSWTPKRIRKYTGRLKHTDDVLEFDIRGKKSLSYRRWFCRLSHNFTQKERSDVKACIANLIKQCK